MSTDPHQICYAEHACPSNFDTTIYKIVLLPGNPGLIGFYITFLQSLGLLLRQSTICRAQNVQFEIFGRSLRGFETSANLHRPDSSNTPRDCTIDSPQLPLSLDQQIDFVEESLRKLCKESHSEQQRVILIGHSVGAFILLEILSRFRVSLDRKPPRGRIKGGICLFPTIVDIAKSKSGKRIGWLLKIPYFPLFVAMLVKLLVHFLPGSLLDDVVRAVTHFPEDAVATTAAFLRSPMGVRQALYMAKYEMDQIRADRLSDGSWEIFEHKIPALFFFFGRSDHWVADRTRDDFIRRADTTGTDKESKPRVEIDTKGIPHGFCTSHENSLAVAQKCVEYVEQIVLASHAYNRPNERTP